MNETGEPEAVVLRLMLFRHAKSDWPQGVADKERPLGPRGRHDAPRMGEEIARRGMKPDLALVSPARRARESWELAGAFLPGVPLKLDDRIYEAAPAQILSVIRETDDAIHTLFLVGHNPGLELTASFLVGEGSKRLRERLGEKFPTAALAVIEFQEAGWREIGRGNGRLVLFLTPGDIE
jgi:phosphohistidine phosphatase